MVTRSRFIIFSVTTVFLQRTPAICAGATAVFPLAVVFLISQERLTTHRANRGPCAFPIFDSWMLMVPGKAAIIRTELLRPSPFIRHNCFAAFRAESHGDSFQKLFLFILRKPCCYFFHDLASFQTGSYCDQFINRRNRKACRRKSQNVHEKE